MRDVLVWSLRLLILFVVLLGLSFVALTLMTPSAEELAELSQPRSPVAQLDTTNAPADSMVITVSDSLQTLVDSLSSEIFFLQLRSDSMSRELDLKAVEVETYASQYDALNDKITELRTYNVSVKDLAKTYETMKIKDIKPIIEKVDDETVIALYKNMGSRTRKNLMQSLSSVRAAQLTKKIAGAKP